MVVKAQASAKAISEHPTSSPSPTTILKSVNNSGNYMCSQRIEMPSPPVKYHDTSMRIHEQINLPNMVEHRNNYNNICHQTETNQYEYDDMQQPQYAQFYNPAQIQHSTTNETQQQADQHTMELRMNNLGNENLGWLKKNAELFGFYNAHLQDWEQIKVKDNS